MLELFKAEADARNASAVRAAAAPTTLPPLCRCCGSRFVPDSGASCQCVTCAPEGCGCLQLAHDDVEPDDERAYEAKMARGE